MQTLYGQKGHRLWNTGKKNKVLKRPIDYLTSINKGPMTVDKVRPPFGGHFVS